MPSASGEGPALTRFERAIALAIVTVYLAFAISLAFTARPQNDEAAYANPGYNLMHTGKLGMTLYELRGYMPQSSRTSFYWQPPLYFLVTAGLYRTLGFGLAQTRLLSIFFGLVCLLSWYTIIRSLVRTAAPALLVTGLISVDYFFLVCASHGRMEMMCVGLGSAGLAIYAHWRRRNLLGAVFWGNLLAGLALLTHPIGIVWAAGVLLAMLVLDRRLLSLKLLIAGAIPYLLVGAAWGAYIIQNIPAFLEQIRTLLVVNETSFDYSHLSHSRILRYLEQEVISRYAAPFGLLGGAGPGSRLKILVLATYLTGVFGILLMGKLRKIPALLWLSLFFISGFFLMAEMSPSKFSYYLPHTSVIMAACAGMFLYSVTVSPRWSLILPVVAVLAAVQLGGAAMVIRRDDYRRTYTPVIAAIEENSPPHSVVMSEAELWFGLWRDHRVLMDPLLGYLSGIRPDVFVTNSVFRDLQEKEGRTNPAALEYFRKLIAESHVVYQDSYSQVYVRDGLSLPAPVAPR